MNEVPSAGAARPAAIPGLMSSAFGGVAGMQIGLPGFEISLFLGYIPSFS